MAKWEYAAIVADGAVTIGENPDEKDNLHLARFLLVQPGDVLHYFTSWDDQGKSPRERVTTALVSYPPWSKPSGFEEFKKEWVKKTNSSNYYKNLETTDPSPRILYESTDILHLVNLAGADGWEITGALGLDGVPEHRMMRREI